MPRDCCFADCWKCPTIVSVFKNSSKTFELLALTLLPLFVKVLDELINAELVKHITSNCLLSDEQYGFHFSGSVVVVLTATNEFVYQALD